MRRTVRVALAAGLLFVLACGGGYKRLDSVQQIPELADLARSAEALRKGTYRVAVDRADGEPLQLAVEEVGSGATHRRLVLIHGVLSDRRTWRFLAGDLGRDHDLLLIDLLGCGESDLPHPASLGEDGYDPTAQARRVLAALRARPDAERWTLVGHSLGGSTVLRMLGAPHLRSEFADVVDRVERAVLLSPLDFALEKVHPEFVDIAELGKVKVGLARALGILPRRVTDITIRSFVDPRYATREEAVRLGQVLGRRSTRRPAQAMITQSVPYDVKRRTPQWERIESLVEDYRHVDVPTLILWGARDETLPLSMGFKLQSQLPRARLTVVRRSKHSLHLERPGFTASLIRSFLSDQDGPPVTYVDAY